MIVVDETYKQLVRLTIENSVPCFYKSDNYGTIQIAWGCAVIKLKYKESPNSLFLRLQVIHYDEEHVDLSVSVKSDRILLNNSIEPPKVISDEELSRKLRELFTRSLKFDSVALEELILNLLNLISS